MHTNILLIHTDMQNSSIYLSTYLFHPVLLARTVRAIKIRAITKLPIQTFCGCARTSLLTIAFSPSQGNSLWHPQWALQVWCHPGELHLLLLCWDHQGGSHPSGLLCSGWGWPARLAPARDSRTGPDVSSRGQGPWRGGQM